MSRHPAAASFPRITRRDVMRTGAAAAAVAALGLPGRALAATLTPLQQAGQRVIFSYSGPTVPQSLLDELAAGRAGGVIFFGDNISGLNQIDSAAQQLRAAARGGPVAAPPLLMTDQEGGEVRRLPGEPTLSEKEIGESSDPVAAATDAGTGAGQLLAGVGMNVNLAPVLDVYRTPGDFEDQFERSYSTDPAVCGRLGGAFITAQRRTGVAATAKHFPGLGAAGASQNTDLRPVTLNLSRATIRSVDEAPYTSAISAGVKLVMASWALYPALDSRLPAGLSPTIIQQELRGRLGFLGVTITDALSAGALTNFGTVPQRAVAAAKAGMDLMLVSAQDVTQARSVVTALADALRSGALDQPTFTASVNRVLTLRAMLP
ncbi:MAG TPA: glycoside hydrolase family 3 N-terminal domain-containing protein [Streptosporangiaceae bacterium]